MREIILNENDIKLINKRLGKELTERFKNDSLPPVFIGVMKGALPFMMDLIREVECPILIDFVQISSYLGTESTGIINLKRDVSTNLKDRNVVIIEDIIDSGHTLVWLKNYLAKNYSPKSISICVLLDKKCKRKVDCEIEYIGKEIGDYFIVGYGLDYDEFYRNEKEIFIPSKEEIEHFDLLNKSM